MDAVAAVIIGAVACLLIGAGAGLLLARGRRTCAPGLAAAALDALQHGAMVVDRDNDAVICNPAGRAMGLLRGDQLALPELRELADKARRSGRPEQTEVRLLHGWLAREPLAVLARAIPAAAGGEIALLVEDVTETRRLADIRRDFVANVSHELKTPVGAIALLSEALVEAQDDPEAVRRFGNRLRHESDRLTRLAQGLIDLSRLESAQPPELALVDLAGVITEATDRIRTAATARDIDVITGPQPDVTVLGVRDQLVTALVNLLDNAIRYSPSGSSVQVLVRAADLSTDIVVIDAGIGIDEADLDRVFERFFRSDPARASSTGGTGLGLAIVKHVAANHNGQVAVSSSLGHGSRFTLSLPAVSRATSAHAADTGTADEPTPEVAR